MYSEGRLGGQGSKTVFYTSISRGSGGIFAQCNIAMCKTFCDTPTEKNHDKQVKMHKFTAIQEVLCNK